MNDFLAVQVANKAAFALKALKSMETMDGVAWNANIYHQGKKVGFVEDRGDGGPTYVQLPEQLQKALQAQAIESGWKSEFCDPASDPLEIFGEFFFSVLADEIEALKRIRPKLKTMTYAQKKGDEPGTFVVFKVPFTEATKAKIIERNGDNYSYFLNEKIDWLLGK